MQGLTVTAVIPKAPASGASAADGASDAVALDGAFAALLAAHIKGEAGQLMIPLADGVGSPSIQAETGAGEDLSLVDTKPEDQADPATVPVADSSQLVMVLASELAPMVVPAVVPAVAPVQQAVSTTTEVVTADAAVVVTSGEVPNLVPTDPSARASLGVAPTDGVPVSEQGDAKTSASVPLMVSESAPGTASSGEVNAAEFAASGKMLPDTTETKLADARIAAPLLSDAQSRPEVTPGTLAGVMNAAYVSRDVEIRTPTTVQPLVGSSSWSDALGEKVVWMAGQKQQVAELRLNPPNLGPMEVRLTLSNDQVSAVFVSHQPAVREAIEAAMPRLREMFADSGMMLGNAMVSSDSLPQQQAPGQDGRSSGSSSEESGFFSLDGTVPVSTRAGGSPTSSGRGLVDLFA